MADVTLQQLLEAGCHFGHQVRRWNPAMTKYIYGARDGVHVFDLVKTKAGLDEAAAFVKTTASQGGKVLFVGTKRQVAEIVKASAVAAGMPYITQRWLGGTLTNYVEIMKRINKMKKLKDQREKGELKKYTKYEQLQIDRDIAKLERFLGGLVSLEKLPEAIFVVDTHKEDVAVQEAIKMKIPVVGLVDSNANPAGIKYVIPTNDDAVGAVTLMVNTISDAIQNSKS
ncbi:MAG: 30S ribosomal protein S2 [Patescibacteria group bacterium]